MSADFAPTNLTNHFLIAMPGLGDALFGKSVVYLCEHGEKGALGLIINKPSGIDMQDLFEKIDLSLEREDLMNTPVFNGGPVQTERGFVLHDQIVAKSDESGEDIDESVYSSTMTIPGGLELTTSRDILESMANGGGPRRVFVTLGYASWGQGQLESEITENSWLTVPASPELIFDTPFEQRYDRALALLGLQSWMIAPDAGHA